MVLLEAPLTHRCALPRTGSVREAAPALGGRDTMGCKVLGAPGSPFQSGAFRGVALSCRGHSSPAGLSGDSLPWPC